LGAGQMGLFLLTWAAHISKRVPTRPSGRLRREAKRTVMVQWNG